MIGYRSRLMMKKATALVPAITAVMIAFQDGLATATTIVNVSIGTETSISGTYGTGPGQYLMPEPYTGSTWHNFETSGSNLADTDGNPTTIGVTLTDTFAARIDGPPIPEPWMDVVKDYRYRRVQTEPNPFSLTISGLTVSQAYRVHLILQGSGNEGGLVTMTSGAAILPASAETSGAGRQATGFTEFVNFATQSFTADDTSAVFSVTRNSTNQYATISGLQIVAVPEPATIGGAMFGLVILLTIVQRQHVRRRAGLGQRTGRGQ